MNEITMSEYILDEAIDALRLAANILGSRGRETAVDRSIEYSERLLKWVKNGKIGEVPEVFPKKQ